jgi:hypothetical protein
MAGAMTTERRGCQPGGAAAPHKREDKTRDFAPGPHPTGVADLRND